VEDEFDAWLTGAHSSGRTAARLGTAARLLADRAAATAFRDVPIVGAGKESAGRRS